VDSLLPRFNAWVYIAGLFSKHRGGGGWEVGGQVWLPETFGGLSRRLTEGYQFSDFRGLLAPHSMPQIPVLLQA